MTRPTHRKGRRNTRETQIAVTVNLDGTGRAEVATGVPFLDHMLELLAAHAGIDLDLSAKGDLRVDAHHTVEDIGICLGEGVKKALGTRGGYPVRVHAASPWTRRWFRWRLT